MLSERGAYLSHEGDKIGIEMALERIWLDWQERRLIEPKWLPLGVNQAVEQILTEIKYKQEAH